MPLGPTALSWLAVGALAVAVGRTGHRAGRSRPGPRRAPGIWRRHGSQPLSPEELTTEIEALHGDASTALRHVAVVRYDAFGDMGGHLSWSLALLDDGGDGVVVTSIHGRSDSRTYAKNVSGWQSSQQLSPEEEEAISFARAPQ